MHIDDSLIKKYPPCQLLKGEQYPEFIAAMKKFMLHYAPDCQIYDLIAKAYLQLEDFEKAYRYTSKALQLNHTYKPALYTMASACFRGSDCDIILPCLENMLQKYEKCLPPPLTDTILDTAAYIYISFLGDSQKCLQCIEQNIRRTPEWRKQVALYSTYLGALNYPPKLLNSTIFDACKKYNQFFQGITPYEHPAPMQHTKLRIGYISPDFRNHVAVYFIYKLLKYHDKSHFEITCYYTNTILDEITDQLKTFVDHWRQIDPLALAAAAEQIHDDQIDILVDLAGHTINTGLPIMAYKPAPLQISGIGYWNTTGLSTVDYYLTDPYCEPMEKGNHYFTEKLLRLPHSHLCYTPPSIMPEVQAIPYRQNGYITFASFNNFAKVTDTALLVWLQIIRRTANAKLIFKTRSNKSYNFELNIIRRLQQIGFSTAEFELRTYQMPYLHEYNDIDIALDTFPYPGGGTTCEALYMGVPVITLCGARHGSRFGYSILKNIGLDECIAFNQNEYVEKALALARNPQHLQNLRQNLRSQMAASPVMDGEEYARDIEQLYNQIWQTHVNSF